MLTSYAGPELDQNLARSAERAMALDFLVSYQLDKQLTAPLTRQSELDTRNRWRVPHQAVQLPVRLQTIGTTCASRIRRTRTSAADDQQIRCIQAGEGACQDDVPFLERGDLDFAQPYRMNPYGVSRARGSPCGRGDQRRYRPVARGALAGSRQLRLAGGSFNRIKLGGEFHHIDTRRIQRRVGRHLGIRINAYHETPVRYGAYVEDRLTWATW